MDIHNFTDRYPLFTDFWMSIISLRDIHNFICGYLQIEICFISTSNYGNLKIELWISIIKLRTIKMNIGCPKIDLFLSII